MYSALSAERERVDDDSRNLFNYIKNLEKQIEELNSRIELITPGNVIKAAQSADEPLQIPIKMARTVDWRTKRQELERKYSKAGVRDELVKEISSPADIFPDK